MQSISTNNLFMRGRANNVAYPHLKKWGSNWPACPRGSPVYGCRRLLFILVACFCQLTRFTRNSSKLLHFPLIHSEFFQITPFSETSHSSNSFHILPNHPHFPLFHTGNEKSYFRQLHRYENMNMKILFIAMHAMQRNSTNATHAMDATQATDATHV